MQLSVQRTFGPPARTYRVDAFTIQVWNTNVLSRLDGSA
jgi:hypothetical protein